ncbi:hypothetical protein BGZ46_008284 [Entomortierella lignicola]|nr:hypothetical protein BGZ46_008284 [Entomortierella lignicola]
MHRALQLPEILLILANYFQLRDLSSLVRVCKLWHHNLNPIIWHDMSFDIPEFILSRSPSAEAIIKHASLIRVITFSASINQRQQDQDAQNAALEYCSGLKQLSFVTSAARGKLIRENQLWQDISELLTWNPQIEIIELSNITVPPPQKFFDALQGLDCLKKFKSRKCCYAGHQIANLVVSHSTNLEELELGNDVIQSQEPWDTTLEGTIIPKLTSLTLQGIVSVEGKSQLILVKQAPNLKVLHLDMEGTPFPSQQFCQQVIPSCPKIEDIKVTTNVKIMNQLPFEVEINDAPLDDTLAQILGVAKVTKFQSPSSGFGPLAMDALRSHSPWITVLNLEHCFKFTSSMAQECLSTMPLLTYFNAPKISQSDIIRGYESGSPWVCIGLQELQISIIELPRLQLKQRSADEELNNAEFMERLSVHAKVFEQLAVLKNIVSLLLSDDNQSLYKTRTSRDQSGGLAFSLKAGLSRLETLKSLVHLDVHGVQQYIALEDARWIQQNWKSIKSIQGDLNPSNTPEDTLQFFSRNNIRIK